MHNINNHLGVYSNVGSTTTSCRNGGTSRDSGSLSNMSTIKETRNNSNSPTNKSRRKHVAVVFLIMLMFVVAVGVAVGITLSYVKKRDITRLHVTFSVDNNGTRNNRQDDISFCSKVQKVLHSTKFRHSFLECKFRGTRQMPAAVHHSYIVDFVDVRDTADVEELKRIVVSAIDESKSTRVQIQNMLYLAEQGSRAVGKSENQSSLGETFQIKERTTTYVRNTKKPPIGTSTVTEPTLTNIRDMEDLSPRIEQRETVFTLTAATPTILITQTEGIQTIKLKHKERIGNRIETPSEKMWKEVQITTKATTAEEIRTMTTVKMVKKIRTAPKVKTVEKIRDTFEVDTVEDFLTAPKLTAVKEIQTAPKVKTKEEIRTTPRVKTKEEIRTTPRVETKEEIRTTSRVKTKEEIRTTPRVKTKEEIRTSGVKTIEIRTTPTVEPITETQTQPIMVDKIQTKAPTVTTLEENPWNKILSGMNLDLDWL